MTVTILVGDVREKLRALADDSIHCCVTSPPYWGLRDYGVEGQIGLEASPAEFIATMVDVFEEVRRVLRPDGTCWINMGDSYATGAGKVGNHPGGGAQGEAWRGARGGHEGKHRFSVGARGTGALTQPNRMPQPGLKPKDLCMIPHRLAIALQEAGWWVRQDIVWSKPNPMPESVRDRCTKAHEYIFLLAKSARYYFDHGAIQEPQEEHERTRRLREQETGLASTYTLRRDEAHGQVAQGSNGCARSVRARQELAKKGTRNKRSVWTVATHPFSEAHFATFPPDLVEPCIKAGCPPGGIVLDPFLGAETTGLVADRLQRHCIGIELNPAYAEIARKRIQGDAALLTEVRVAA